MRATRRAAFWGLLVLAIIGRGQASPSDVVLEALRTPPDASGAGFRLLVPPPQIEPTPEGARVRLRGFDTPERAPGAPDLPTHSVLVAIPPGSTPRLAIRSLGEETLPGIRPAPVPRWVAEGAEPSGSPFPETPELARGSLRSRPLREAEARFYEGRAPYPRDLAWIEEVGVLRDQRFARIRLAPVRYDPAIGGLRIARGLEVVVHFDGDDGRRTAPPADDAFEQVYRKNFVNYAQGRGFRLSALQAAGYPAGGGGSRLGASGSEAESFARSGSSSFSPAQTSGPRHRIRIRQNGLVRLDRNRMSGTGFLSEPLSSWKLTNRGVEVPLQIHDANANDLVDPGDWVQFYGQALDDEPETVVNHDFDNTVQDIFEARDFTDENVYFLTVEAGPRSRMSERDATPTNTRTPPADFEAVAHREVEDAWRPLGGADPWYWSPTQSNPASGALQPSRTESVPLPGLASPTAGARVIVRLRGITEDASLQPDHKSRVTLKNDAGQTLASQDDDGSFDGRALFTHDFTWTHPGSGPTLSDPAQVTIEALSVPGAPASYRNQFILDFVEIRYRRAFQASGNALTFDWPDGDAEFQVSGFTNSAVEVYEITGRVGGTGVVEAVRLTNATVSGAGPFTVRFRVDDDPALSDGTPRRFLVVAETAVSVPADPDFQGDTVSDLRDSTHQADLIVIAHPDVLDDSPGSPFDQWLNLRASQGISSKVALLEDVQDEFNDGLPGPLALENFLRWVMSANPGEGWAEPKPTYVLLLGDGSYDYKAGTANGSFVPTPILFLDRPELGYYAADNELAAVVGDDHLADLVVGRIPARSVAEANLVLQKILDYERNPPAGQWTRHAIFVSDRGKKDSSGDINDLEAFEFENTNAAGESFMKIPPHTSRKLRYFSDYCDSVTNLCDAFAINQDIKQEVNGTAAPDRDGGAILQYTGHGNFVVWSDDAFFDERDPPPRDTDDLANGGRLPWLLAHNCLTGGFHTTSLHSMGEDWLFRNGGGAVAVYSPTGLSFNFIGRTVTEVMWEDMFGPSKERAVSVPIMDNLAKLCGQGSIEACQHYAYLGDPSLNLVFPAVAPPTDPDAVGGNQVVDLTWTASATPGVTYDVYRTTDPVRTPYTKINPAPLAETSYRDTGVANAVTYYYVVVALDSEGFESRWSNFNSDCDVDGPDCVKATPLNPNPPSPPTGVVVTDPEKGFRLEVSWNANSENDLSFYTVHWGTQSGVYTHSESAGRKTTFTITNLENGVTYYVAVTATNTSGKTSGFSEEKSGTPTWVRGVKSPDVIVDLRVDKSGTDAVLTWSAIAEDIYGKAETVDRYQIYRGATPNFVPSPANLLAETTATSYTDAGALGAGLPDYHYLVRAVDVDGNLGGLGRQLPAGIDALRVDRSGRCSVSTSQSCTNNAQCPSGETCDVSSGKLLLSWPAVTTDFDGGPTIIDRYEIYASSQPFDRADIRDGLIPLLQTTTATSIEILPPAEDQYYSVLAVDNRGNQSPY